MSLIAAAAAPVYERPGTVFTGLAAPSRGARETAVWRVCIDPGTVSPVHQLTREEIFVCTAGRAVATIAGLAHEVTAGDALVVPKETDFSIANPGDGSFEAVVVLPVGGKAVLQDAEPFVPPWAE